MYKNNNALPKYIFNWKAGLIMILAMLLFSAVLASVDAASIFLFKKNLQYSDLYMMLLNTSGLLGVVLAFDFFICRPQTGKPLNFNFSTTNFYTYLIIFPMMFGMMLIAEFFTSLIPTTGAFWGDMYQAFSQTMRQLSQDTPTMLLRTVILAPLFEEIIFRGIIMKGLINKGWKPWKAVVLSAVIFGLVHANPWQFVGAVFLGCVLGLVYYKTKSLLLPMLLHAFNNLFSVIMLKFFKSESISESVDVSQWLILLVGLIIFVPCYYFFTEKYKVIYTEE